MGCDGGSIPKRSEMVKTQGKRERADGNQQRVSNWFFCALSKEPLQKPIVACPLGKLYNKEAIIKYLLDSNAYGESIDHVKSLKDFTTLQLVDNPTGLGENNDSDFSNGVFICPITRKEMNGKIRFIFSKPCGCVISEQAHKQVVVDDGDDNEKTCLVCSQPVVQFVPINGTAEEMESLLKDLDLVDHKGKNKKKRKKTTTAAAAASSMIGDESTRKRVAKVLPILHRNIEDKVKSSETLQAMYSNQAKSEALTSNGLFANTFNRY